MKNVLLINSSPRKNGNSAYLYSIAKEYFCSNGCNVAEIYLPNEELVGCKACGYCKKSGKCVSEDNTVNILNKMRQSDVIIMFCPVYFCGFDSHTKKLIDRSECMYQTKPKTNGKIALVASFGATLEENYIGMHYGMKYFAYSLKKEYVGIKPFANTDNLTKELKEQYKQDLLQFIKIL